MNLSLSRSDDTPLEWLDNTVVDTLERICVSLQPAGRPVSVVVVDDTYMRDINARFRGRDRTTDVISFSYLDEDTPAAAAADDPIGEVYISHETIVKEATDLGVDTGHMFLRVGVHGLLHVLGHDHESDDDAERMEGKERSILTAHLGSETADALL